MKPTAISADVLFEDHSANLKWEWVASLGVMITDESGLGKNELGL